MLTCSKTGDRSGRAWQKVLEPFSALEFVVSDGAKGIQAGVEAVAAKRREAAAEAVRAVPLTQGLDVFHTAQEARRVLAGPWRVAEAAWEAAEKAEKAVADSKRVGKDARGVAGAARAAWSRAEQRLDEVWRLESAWERARGALAVFRPDGTLNDRSWAGREIGVALADLTGEEWAKTRNALTDKRALAFLDRLHERLAEAEPDAGLREACVRRWWLRHRRSSVLALPPGVQGEVLGLLDGVIRDRALSEAEEESYERVSSVLGTTVRASSAVEGINSVLRMQQGRHRKMTQGLLDLKRLYWNCRRLMTGRRRDRSPYEMLGVELPSMDFWSLLAGPVGRRAEELSSK